MKKYYILGASGFIGSGMKKYLMNRGHQVISERTDVSDFPNLLAEFKKTRPEIVINFAGAHAYPTVRWCEDHKEETVKVNVGGAINAVLAALESGAYPIQISSGCVYTGGLETSFSEEDKPNFFGSFYSRMRIVMQNALEELPVLQARIRMPMASYSHPRNLINKIISYQKIISVPNSITLVEDLWPALEKLSVLKPIGILNLTNDSYIEHRDIAEAYKKYINPKHHYAIISPEELLNKITKTEGSNCVLSNAKAKSLGIKLPAINEKRLEEIMLEYKKTL